MAGAGGFSNLMRPFCRVHLNSDNPRKVEKCLDTFIKKENYSAILQIKQHAKRMLQVERGALAQQQITAAVIKKRLAPWKQIEQKADRFFKQNHGTAAGKVTCCTIQGCTRIRRGTMHRKSIIIIAAIILFATVYQAFADYYVIRLKNGKEIAVQKYWDEGPKIRFYRDGGSVAIPKEDIKAIEKQGGTPAAEPPGADAAAAAEHRRKLQETRILPRPRHPRQKHKKMNRQRLKNGLTSYNQILQPSTREKILI